MTPSSPEPRWLRWLSNRVLLIGPWRATVLATLVAWGLAAGVSQLVSDLAGLGDRLSALVAASVCALLLVPPAAIVLLRALADLERARRQLAEVSVRDELTGVFNRRHFMQLAEQEWTRCRRYDTAAALLLIDADHFKRVNESHGHVAGDALLREIAAATGRSLRQVDLLARFGGEELVVFLPHTDPLGALDVAERIRAQVALVQLCAGGRSVGTTVSIGVASLGASQADLQALIHDADTALYEAKAAGRNCVRAAPIQPRRSGETRRVPLR